MTVQIGSACSARLPAEAGLATWEIRSVMLTYFPSTATGIAGKRKKPALPLPSRLRRRRKRALMGARNHIGVRLVTQIIYHGPQHGRAPNERPQEEAPWLKSLMTGSKA